MDNDLLRVSRALVNISMDINIPVYFWGGGYNSIWFNVVDEFACKNVTKEQAHALRIVVGSYPPIYYIELRPLTDAQIEHKIYSMVLSKL